MMVLPLCAAWRGQGCGWIIRKTLVAARQFAPNGLDAVLLTTGGEQLEKIF